MNHRLSHAAARVGVLLLSASLLVSGTALARHIISTESSRPATPPGRAAPAANQEDTQVRRELDSLERLIQRGGPPDTVLLNAYFESVHRYKFLNADSALARSARGVAVARRLGFEPGLLRALAQRGQILYNNSNFLEASRLAQELVRRTDHAPARLLKYRAFGFKLLGHGFARQNQRARATGYMRQALAVAAQPVVDLETRANVLSSVVQFYTTQIFRGDLSDSTARQTRSYAR